MVVLKINKHIKKLWKPIRFYKSCTLLKSKNISVKPECTLTMADADLFDLMTGKLNSNSVSLYLYSILYWAINWLYYPSIIDLKVVFIALGVELIFAEKYSNIVFSPKYWISIILFRYVTCQQFKLTFTLTNFHRLSSVEN